MNVLDTSTQQPSQTFKKCVEVKDLSNGKKNVEKKLEFKIQLLVCLFVTTVKHTYFLN